MLHLLKIYLVIKVDDIFGLTALLIDHTLCVNLSDILFA